MNKLSFYDTDNTDNQETPAPKEFKYANLLLALVALALISTVAVTKNRAIANLANPCSGTPYRIPVEGVKYGDSKAAVLNEYKMEKVQKSDLDMFLFEISDSESPFENAHFHFKNERLTDVIFKLRNNVVAQLGGAKEAFPFMLGQLIEKFGEKLIPENTTATSNRFTYRWPVVDGGYIGLHYEPHNEEIYLQYACATLKQ
jgi:hypothetical protein